MQGLILNDENGNLVLGTNQTVLGIVTQFVIPNGNAGQYNFTFNAPSGVDFTKNKPFAYIPECGVGSNYSLTVKGNTIYAGYQVSVTLALANIWYGVYDISASSCRIAVRIRVGFNSDIVIFGGVG